MAPQVHPPALDVGFLARSLTQTQSWKLSELDPKAQSPWDQKEPLAHTQRGSRPSDPLPGPPPSQEGGNTDRSHSLRPNPKLRAEGGGGRGNQNRPQTQPPPPPPKEDAQATLLPTEPRPGCCPAPPPQRPQVSRPSSAAPGKAGARWGLGQPPGEDSLPTARAGRPQPPCRPSLCLLQGAPASSSSARVRHRERKNKGPKGGWLESHDALGGEAGGASRGPNPKPHTPAGSRPAGGHGDPPQEKAQFCQEVLATLRPGQGGTGGGVEEKEQGRMGEGVRLGALAGDRAASAPA